MPKVRDEVWFFPVTEATGKAWHLSFWAGLTTLFMVGMSIVVRWM